MKDRDKTKQQLIAECAELRRRVEQLEAARGSQEAGGDRWVPADPKWRSLVEGSPLFILVVDREGRILFANHSDSGAPAERMLGKRLADFSRRDNPELVTQCVQNVFQTGRPCTTEGPALRFDNELHWYASHFGPIVEAGQVVAVSVVSINVTDRKRVEQTLHQTQSELEDRVRQRTADLQESNEQLRAIQDGMLDGLLLVDRETRRFLRVNPAFCRMLGYTEEELLAMSVDDIHPPDLLPATLERFRAHAAASGARSDDIVVLRKDGSVFLADVRSHHVRHHDRPALVAIFQDITERKAAEEALRQSRDELRTIYEGAVDGILIVDSETGCYVLANPAMCAMLGYTEEQLVSLTVYDIHTPDTIDAILARIREHPPGPRRIGRERSIIRADGSVLYADIASTHINYRGRHCVIGFFRDVTERRRAEEALRQSRDELRTIYEGAADGIVIADCATGRFLLANPALCQMLGYSEAQLLDMSVCDIHPPDVAAAVLEKFRTQSIGPRMLTRDRLVIRSDGSLIYADIANTRIDYRGRPCIVGFFRDVTDRKQAEAALRRSHDELQAIYDGTTDGMNILDIEHHKALRVNSALCRMLGYNEEEALALAFADAHPTEDLEWILKRLRDSGKKPHSLEENIPMVRKDGSKFYVDIASSRIIYDDRPCLLNFFRDVTERRRAQEALERERRTLEHMLRASDHERQVIAYDIHDGLAQQLTGAILQFQIFEHFRGVKPLDAAEAYNAGMTMLKQSHFEARRLISGVRPPVLDEAGVVEAIAHLVHEQRRAAAAKISVHSRVDFDRLAPVLENAVYRIVQEALANACNHSHSERVRVLLVQSGDTLRIEIRDWGCGFSPHNVDDNRFGLKGIRERARLLGGKCRIQSKAGKGTRVNVELPVLPKKNHNG